MGGCASKPNDLDTADKAPAPVEAPAPPTETPEKVEAETVAQETEDGDEIKDRPVVEASEPTPEAAKTEEAEAKPDAEPAKAEAEEQAKETPKEEKKEVAETVATA